MLTKDTNCDFKRVGDYGDGGYLICDNFVNNSEAMVNLGIQGFDNFGCEFVSLYKKINYQFDCTDEHLPICPGF